MSLGLATREQSLDAVRVAAVSHVTNHDGSHALGVALGHRVVNVRVVLAGIAHEHEPQRREVLDEPLDSRAFVAVAPADLLE